MTESNQRPLPLLSIAEFLPLTVFLVSRRVMDAGEPLQWQATFHLGGLLGLGLICLCLAKKMTMNRILLGINLYLISGSLAFVTGQYWLNDLYEQLRASGMLLWVGATGVVTLCFSPAGFIGNAEAFDVKKRSSRLLLATAAAFALSFFFRGNPLFSEVIPFACLFMAQIALSPKPIQR